MSENDKEKKSSVFDSKGSEIFYLNKALGLMRKNERKFRCEICKKPSVHVCSKCLSVYYCGEEHQRKDWPRHKRECSLRAAERDHQQEQGPAQKDIKEDMEEDKKAKVNDQEQIIFVTLLV